MRIILFTIALIENIGMVFSSLIYHDLALMKKTLDKLKHTLTDEKEGSIMFRLKNMNNEVDLSALIKMKFDIIEEISQILSVNKLPNNLFYNDWKHSIKNKMHFYSYKYAFWEREIDQGISGKRVDTLKQELEKNTSELINEIQDINNIIENPYEKTTLNKLISLIKSKFLAVQIKTNSTKENNIFLRGSDGVLQNIIKELKTNYNKYGTNGTISVTNDKNHIIITLKNKKKETNEMNFSSNKGLKLLSEYMKLLKGDFEYNYNTENCITEIRLPIYKETKTS